MSKVVVTFVESSSVAEARPAEDTLLEIAMAVVPRVGETVRLARRHAQPTDFRVQDVLYTPLNRGAADEDQVIIAVSEL